MQAGRSVLSSGPSRADATAGVRYTVSQDCTDESRTHRQRLSALSRPQPRWLSKRHLEDSEDASPPRKTRQADQLHRHKSPSRGRIEEVGVEKSELTKTKFGTNINEQSNLVFNSDPVGKPNELARQPRHGPHYNQLLHLLNDLQNHRHSWSFLAPVNRDEVADYYDIIKEPMDLSTMEDKLKADLYLTPEDFTRDAVLMFNNCRTYNQEGTVYVKCANKLEKYMWQQITAIPGWSHLEP